MTYWLPGVGAEIGVSTMPSLLGLESTISVTVQGPS
jgi:hypothetical protein